jgi:hypothetical protein
MERDVRILTDAQLLEACRPNDAEKRAYHLMDSKWGCLSCLSLGLVVSVGLLAWRLPEQRSGLRLLCLLFGLIIGFTIWIGIAVLSLRRRKPYWRELQRRYAGAPLQTYLEEAKNRAGASWQTIIVLRGGALPHGDDWVALVWLEPEGSGRIQMRSLYPTLLDFDTIDKIKRRISQKQLEADASRRLSQLAAASFENSGDINMMSTVIDGSPAEVVVYDRQRGCVLQASCNLSGVPPRKESHPVVQLMRGVLDAARSDPMVEK